MTTPTHANAILSTTPSNKIPEPGMLIVPLHKPEGFSTILDVEVSHTEGGSPRFGPKIRVQYLRISDNKKIRTVWYPNCITFWKYYVEK